MKMKNLFLAIFLWALGITILGAQPAPAPAPTPVANAAPTNSSGGRIQFATPIYDFGKVSAGEPVKYSYIFTNIGEQVLEVTAVQPSCGCTAAGEWTRRVEPGKTGTIPIQFNTGSYNGQVTKTITVSSSDRHVPQTVLQLKGAVWRPIEVTPQFAVLNVMPEAATNPPAKVRIVNNLETPLTLSPPEINNKAFAASLKELRPGKEYEMLVTTVPPLSQGNVQGQITIKTSSTNTPVITVTAWANVQPVIAVNPPQIVLPAGTLANRLTPSVMIQNNGTNQLTLSEPTVNAEGVEVQLKELAAGRSYSAMLTFPAGFEAAPGKQLQFTVKSSHPQRPEIKVPILQMPRPAVQAAATAKPPTVIPPAAQPTGLAKPAALVPTTRPNTASRTPTPPPPRPPGAPTADQ